VPRGINSRLLRIWKSDGVTTGSWSETTPGCLIRSVFGLPSGRWSALKNILHRFAGTLTRSCKSKRKYRQLARIYRVAFDLIDIRESESFQMWSRTIDWGMTENTERWILGLTAIIWLLLILRLWHAAVFITPSCALQIDAEVMIDCSILIKSSHARTALAENFCKILLNLCHVRKLKLLMMIRRWIFLTENYLDQFIGVGMRVLSCAVCLC